MNESSVIDALVIEFADAVSHFLPSNFSHLLEPFLLQIFVKPLIGAERVYGVCHSIDVPIINLDDLVEYLSTSRLLGDNGRGSALHGLKRRTPNRLRHRRHDKTITCLIALIHLLASLEAREVHTVGYTLCRCQINHLPILVTRPCKAEADVLGTFAHQVGCLHKIFRSLLHSDATEEGDHLLLATIHTRNVKILLWKRVNSIVHSKALARVLVILTNDSLASKFRHTHDAVCMIHAILLYRIHCGINLTT